MEQDKICAASRPIHRAWPMVLAVLAIAWAAMLAPVCAYAVPSREAVATYTQPDGATFEATTYGDESFSYVQTTSGYLVQKNSDGVWCYVTADGEGLALGNSADGAAPFGALSSSAFASDSMKAAYASLAGEEYPAIVREEGAVTTLSDIEAVQGDGSENVEYGLEPQSDTGTSLPLITIVIGFDGDATGCSWTADEQRYSTTFDWASRLFTGEYSIGNFYTKMSKGKFTWAPAIAETSAYGEDGNTNASDKAGDGIIHVTLNGNHGNWEIPNTNESAKLLHSAFAEALDKASDYIDFSAYDANHDGKLETTEAGLLFIVAGYETSYFGSGEKAPSTWAHSWNLSNMVTGGAVTEDGVAIDHYTTMGETIEQEYTVAGGTETRKEPMLVGTVAHELGHYLGLSDLYDTKYAESGEWLGYDVYGMSTMASGCWGNIIVDEGTRARKYIAAGFDPFSLVQLGYASPVEIAEDGIYDVTSLTDSSGYQVYRIDTGNPDEYYLIENRQYESFDIGLEGFYLKGTNRKKPSYDYVNDTGGIVIWHIDQGIFEKYDANLGTSDANQVNTVTHRPAIMPLYLEGTSLFDGGPLVFYPFYNSAIGTTFPQAGTITLPFYDGEDLRSERTSTGITVTASVQSSTDMKIKVDIPDTKVVRLAGDTALDTMGKIVDTGRFAVGGTVVLAKLSDFPDALTAAGIAGLAEAPVLLTDTDSLSAQTAAQLAILKPDTIIVCGGTAAVSKATAEAAQKAAGAESLYRCAGDSRSGTACAIYSKAEQFTESTFGTTAFITTGANFADALAVAPYTYRKHFPVFLTESDGTLSDETVKAMAEGGITNYYILGGADAVPSSVVEQLAAEGFGFKGRLAGDTRYETCEKVAEFELENGLSAGRAAIATGENYKDALTGAALCGKWGSVLLLANDDNRTAIDAIVKGNKDSVRTAYIFGGTSAVSSDLESYLAGMLE